MTTTRRLGAPPTWLAALLLTCCARAAAVAADPLPSWNNTPTKQAILKFVAETTKPGVPGFIPPAERIATFDNDGTLWAEQPLYAQGVFAIDRVKAMAPEHPDWKDKEPFKTILSGDLKSAMASGEQGILALVMISHAGMTNEAFDKEVREWMATAQDPRFKRPYTALVYQPMLELLAYLRADGFRTYIVSAGGVEFMRAMAEKSYGIPPEQVIGSTIGMKYAEQNGAPVFLRLPRIDFIDDGAAKPVAIQRSIGRQPVLAFGNSDGDQQMLEWTAAGNGRRFMGLVHHTDADREWAYDRESDVGKLDKALDEANAKGWTVVDMKRDWKKVFPFEK